MVRGAALPIGGRLWARSEPRQNANRHCPSPPEAVHARESQGARACTDALDRGSGIALAANGVDRVTMQASLSQCPRSRRLTLAIREAVAARTRRSRTVTRTASERSPPRQRLFTPSGTHDPIPVKGRRDGQEKAKR